MADIAPDIQPTEWTDEEWTANAEQVFNVLGVTRGMKRPEIADAMGMPRSTFYDKLDKGSFTAKELRRAATVLGVPVVVFYEPVDFLFTILGSGGTVDATRTGSFSSLVLLPEVEGQTTFDDLLDAMGKRPELSPV
jgi:hypothetical protein